MIIILNIHWQTCRQRIFDCVKICDRRCRSTRRWGTRRSQGLHRQHGTFTPRPLDWVRHLSHMRAMTTTGFMKSTTAIAMVGPPLYTHVVPGDTATIYSIKHPISGNSRSHRRYFIMCYSQKSQQESEWDGVWKLQYHMVFILRRLRVDRGYLLFTIVLSCSIVYVLTCGQLASQLPTKRSIIQTNETKLENFDINYPYTKDSKHNS